MNTAAARDRNKSFTHISFVPESLIWVRHAFLLRTGRLSNDDGGSNENGKNTIGLFSKTTIFHVHHAFL